MARGFANIIDYVQTQLDTFDQRDVCRVDSLVLSWLAYYRIPQEMEAVYTEQGVPLKELYRAEWFEPMCGTLYDAQSSRELLSAAAASPRFRNIIVAGYTSKLNEIAEQQFSAMTFQLSPRSTFVAFRGTDNTLVGWKEDFNMSFQTAIPSQVAAVRYLERVAARTEGRIWTGGHSKGGNLAVYAGMMCSSATRERLVKCFTHDGPGFSEATMADPRWHGASELVDKTIPRSSVIGMIFENQEKGFRVVRSHSTGLSQHDPFSWEVDWRDFVVEEKIGMSASILDTSVNEWLSATTPDERGRFVDAVFSVMAASGMSTIADIKHDWRSAVPKMLLAAAELDQADRQLVLTAIGDITRAMVPAPAGRTPEEDAPDHK